MRFATIMTATLAVVCGPLSAQEVTGRLIDATTEEPIEGATVALLQDDRAVRSDVTDDEGEFSLRLPGEDAYRLRADRIGYGTATTPALLVDEDQSVELEFRLLPRAVELNPITVVASSERPPGPAGGFATRAERATGGHFIDRDDIEDRSPLRTTDLLAELPGVEVDPDPRGFGQRVRLRGCNPSVFLDGVRVSMVGSTIDDLAGPLELEGIEVYPGPAELPPEFAVDGGCGAIVLWTRRSV